MVERTRRQPQYLTRKLATRQPYYEDRSQDTLRLLGARVKEWRYCNKKLAFVLPSSPRELAVALTW